MITILIPIVILIPIEPTTKLILILIPIPLLKPIAISQLIPILIPIPIAILSVETI